MRFDAIDRVDTMSDLSETLTLSERADRYDANDFHRRASAVIREIARADAAERETR